MTRSFGSLSFRLIFCALSALVVLGTSWRALAQTSTYTNTTVGAIGGTTACGTTNLVRTITVPASDNFTIADLDVGFLASHSWRGDIRLDLTSPASTTVRLITTNTNSNSLDNYNVRMDDSAGTLINTAPHNTNDGLVAPPYENLVRPNNALSAFNGENSVGTWTLTMCDAYPSADDGQFRRADLFFTHLTGADLSLMLSSSNSSPTTGTNVVLTFTLSHTGPDAASGVTTQINLPTGLSYVSDDSGGDYNSATGVWTLPASISNTSVSLQITAYVETSGNYDITSEIATSSQPDPDSTPGNGVTTEDDYAALTLNPVTPPVPTLTCPGAPYILDWDSVVWNAGDMTNTYTVSGETIKITVTDADNTLLNDANFGGQTPAESVYDSGGLVPGQSDLHFLRNPPTRSSSVDIVYNLGTAGKGFSKVQLSLFDIDQGNSQFEDKVTVTGSLNGVNVPVTSLFTSTANTSLGNSVTGTGASTPTQSNGNMTLEFQSAIDKLTLSYYNGPGAPANPGNQGMSIHDLNFCKALSAQLSASKSAAVYDPQGLGLYMIPGNDVIYTITFTNTGDGPADNDSVVVIDAMPSEIEFYNGDIDGPGPETNPVSGTDHGSGLVLNYASDVRYSNAATAPASFAACTYTPTAGYDPNVTYICLNPSGSMAAGSPNPSFDLKFRARIK